MKNILDNPNWLRKTGAALSIIAALATATACNSSKGGTAPSSEATAASSPSSQGENHCKVNTTVDGYDAKVEVLRDTRGGTRMDVNFGDGIKRDTYGVMSTHDYSRAGTYDITVDVLSLSGSVNAATCAKLVTVPQGN